MSESRRGARFPRHGPDHTRWAVLSQIRHIWQAGGPYQGAGFRVPIRVVAVPDTARKKTKACRAREHGEQPVQLSGGGRFLSASGCVRPCEGDGIGNFTADRAGAQNRAAVRADVLERAVSSWRRKKSNGMPRLSGRRKPCCESTIQFSDSTGHEDTTSCSARPENGAGLPVSDHHRDPNPHVAGAHPCRDAYPARPTFGTLPGRCRPSSPDSIRLPLP